MNLYITSEAKQKQIAFLISLDNTLSGKYRAKTSQLFKRVNTYLSRKNNSCHLSIEEINDQRIELYSDSHLIGYYTNH